MKKTISILLVILTLLATLVGCDGPKQEKITIEISSETRTIRDNMFAEINIIGIGKDEQIYNYNKNTRDYIFNRKSQAFPEVTTTNKLEKITKSYGDVYTLSNDNTDCIVLYIHGGAWVWEIDALHVTYCDELVDLLNAKVYMPIYPLAPQATYKETYEMVEELYDELLELNKPIYIFGDSAGGTITLGLTLNLKEEGKKLPDKVVLMAPCADLSFSNPDIDTYQVRDGMLPKYECIICAQLWAVGSIGTEEDFASELENNQLLCPLVGDYTDFPDTLLYVGTSDILCPDNLLLYDKMCDADINCTLVEGKGLWHVYPIFPISERTECLEILQNFIIGEE